jgi:serine/threonine protein kinase
MMATGETPYAGRDTLSQLLALTTADPKPMRAINPEVPTALTDLVKQLLAKDPNDRLPSAEAVVAHLQALEDEQPRITTRQASASPPQLSTTTPARETGHPLRATVAIRRLFRSDPETAEPRRLRGWLWLVGAALAVIGLVGMVVYLLRT